jgi:hypothetical protein
VPATRIGRSRCPSWAGHVPENAGALYLNTGTWRTVLPFGVGGFGRLRAYTMVFCYNAAEQVAGPDDGRTFEAWTGHLAADRLGPYDETVKVHSRARAGVMRLAFESLEVIAVEREWNGAELRVNFGVDDQGHQVEFDQVRAGTGRLPITQPPLPLDPDLDGDLWFYGVEVDWGNNPLDYDDPLPWAMAPEVGLEPTTHRLTADCSTIELLWNSNGRALYKWVMGASTEDLSRALGKWGRSKCCDWPAQSDEWGSARCTRLAGTIIDAKAFLTTVVWVCSGRP